MQQCNNQGSPPSGRALSSPHRSTERHRVFPLTGVRLRLSSVGQGTAPCPPSLRSPCSEGILEGHFFLRAPLVSCFKDSKKTTFPTFSAQRLSPRGTNAFSPTPPRRRRMLAEEKAPATASMGSRLRKACPAARPVHFAFCILHFVHLTPPGRTAGGKDCSEKHK